MNNASTVCWRMIPEADRRPKIMELAPWAEGLRGARGGTPKQIGGGAENRLLVSK